MNPQSSEGQGRPAPPQAAEQAPAGENSAASPIEGAPAGPETGSVPPVPSMAMPALPAIPLPTVPAIPNAAASDNPATSAQGQNPPIKDDGDLIEKEWVNKAKQIVEHNRDDPHKQSEEMTVFRADYMKKRYGKTIKLNP